MSFYQESIIKATRCDPSEAHEIEDIMRHDIFHSTLDWMDRKTFDRGAREAYQILKAMRQRLNENQN